MWIARTIEGAVILAVLLAVVFSLRDFLRLFN
jgi:hypothetical protein